jgi:hypothetical protein
MKTALQKVIAWIILSSADPTEVSLTVRGALIAVIPTLIAVAGVAHVNRGDDSVSTAFEDTLAQVIHVTLTLTPSAIAA